MKQFIFVLSLILCQTAIAAASQPSRKNDPLVLETEQALKTAMRSMNVPFISNFGQVDARVAFYADTFGGRVFVTKKGEIVYALAGRSTHSRAREVPGFANYPHTERPGHEPGRSNRIGGVALRERFNYATQEDRVNSTVKGYAAPSSTVNYFLGNDRSQWKRNIPAFDTVSLGEIAPGIDLHLRAYGENVEKLFHVRPGADSSRIRVTLQGAESFRVLDTGELEAATALGPVRFTAPIAFQEGDNGREYVEVAYRVKGNEYSFSVAEYDTRRELVIDPLLASTFFGSSGTGGEEENSCPSLALDGSGNIYVAGLTSSPRFPTTAGAWDAALGGDFDIFISRFNPILSTLEASTFLGGSFEEYFPSLALDSSDNVYVTGRTDSADFPTTVGAGDRILDGLSDAFVSRLNPDLTALEASSFLGGSSNEYASSLALDDSGNVYITGHTSSPDFPTSTAALDDTLDGNTDVFVSRFNPILTVLEASTFLGGSSDDSGLSLAIDGSGNVYVQGNTSSPDFPTISGVWDETHNGGSDYFISRLNSDLTILKTSTFLGGSSSELPFSNALILDGSGNVFVTGETWSSNFPTTSGAWDETMSGSSDIFVSRFTPTLTILEASTFLGGSSGEYIPSLALDGSSNIYVTGLTYSSDFPTTAGASDETFQGGGDVFISCLTSDLTVLRSSTFLGGSSQDCSTSLVLDEFDNVYVAGETRSSDFPIMPGAWDETLDGNTGIFISRLVPGLSWTEWSTYLGSTPGESRLAVTVDPAGATFVAGRTWSADFPVSAGAWDMDQNGNWDIFISRLLPDLTGLEASTFLGGSSNENSPSLALDDLGNIYVAGQTLSDDFPTSAGAWNTTRNGDSDIFVSRLTSGLTDLESSTYLGGLSDEHDPSLTFDGSGSVYVTGTTWSSDFPTTAGVWDNTMNGESDIFVSRFIPGLTGLESSTFLGGSYSEDEPTLALDGSGNVYVAGTTWSHDFPTTSGAWDESKNNICDVFISRLLPDLTSLEASTFLGGSSSSDVFYYPSLAIDWFGNVYVAGQTSSSNFPVTAGAWDETMDGRYDAFVSRFNPGLTDLEASTFIGGSSGESGIYLAIDGSGNVYAAGMTWSSDFPSTEGAWDETHNGSTDLFAVQLSSDLSALNSSTFVGGAEEDQLHGMVLGSDDALVMVGRTFSSDFPTTSRVFDNDNSEGDDGFIVKLHLDYPLNIDFQGTGSGTVTLDPPDIDLNVDGGDVYSHGTIVTLTAAADPGSMFTGWTGDNDCMDGSIVMNTAHTCIASFSAAHDLTIDFQGSGSGTINLNPPGTNLTGDGSETYIEGTVVALEATPDVSSTFVGWSGTSDCADGSVTMNTPHTCGASFTLKNHTVTPSSSNRYCTIEPSIPQIVNHGATQQFIITPDTDCALTRVNSTCGGVLTGNVFITGSVSGDCEVEGMFNCWYTSHNVTPSVPGGNGTIDPAATQFMKTGDKVAFDLIPTLGYHIGYVDGSCGGSLSGSSYTTNLITSSCSVTAHFFDNTLEVTPNAEPGGSIDPADVQFADYGSSIAFTVTPNPGFTINTVTGCEGILADNIYTTGPVTTDCGVTAIFTMDDGFNWLIFLPAILSGSPQ